MARSRINDSGASHYASTLRKPRTKFQCRREPIVVPLARSTQLTTYHDRRTTGGHPVAHHPLNQRDLSITVGAQPIRTGAWNFGGRFFSLPSVTGQMALDFTAGQQR